MSMRLYDAHNHLQDERLLAQEADVWAQLEKTSVRGMVVNGSCESDWAAVEEIAIRHPMVLPAYGYHPWYVRERSSQWQTVLEELLNRRRSVIGEIGLDRWIKDFDLPQQEEAFIWQWRLAAERGLPVTVHCLKAWGRLLELMEVLPRLVPGFLLHSYGGPAEMIPAFTKLGAYFSISGYFAFERKERQRECFRQVPRDRLLVETDAPDMSLPPERVRYPLPDAAAGPVNHPANLEAVYEFTAELLGEEVTDLAPRLEENFQRLFGRIG